MYSWFRHVCEQALRIPPAPSAPPGNEASAQIFRAAPNYYRYLLAIWALRTFGLFVLLVVALIGPVTAGVDAYRSQDQPLLLGMSALALAAVIAFLVFSVIYLAVIKLDFEKRWYVVTDRSLRIREGVFSVRELTVTFANIQNIAISQGPIQRLLNIGDLRVDTAGGGGTVASPGQQNAHIATFRGIGNAYDVRALIQARLKNAKDSGLGDEQVESTTAWDLARRGRLIEALQAVQAEARLLRETVTR